MSRITLTLVLLAGAGCYGARSIVRAPAKAGATTNDLARFQGGWELVRLTYDGRDMRRVFGFDSASIKGHRVRARRGREEFMSKILLKPSASPKQVDQVMQPGEVARGIYKFQGDLLIECFGKLGEGRPRTFDDREALLVVLRRRKEAP